MEGAQWDELHRRWEVWDPSSEEWRIVGEANSKPQAAGGGVAAVLDTTPFAAKRRAEMIDGLEIHAGYAERQNRRRMVMADGVHVGQDDLPVTGVKLIDERTVEIQVPGLQPVMQMHTGFNIKSAEGTPMVGSVYLTIHKTQ